MSVFDARMCGSHLDTGRRAHMRAFGGEKRKRETEVRANRPSIAVESIMPVASPCVL